jgi:conjugative relaxase-like TrwC/TraI family protein
MIRITQQDSAKDAKRYYATADYYSEGQELVGSWGGKGAARLGLEETVDKLSFERMCDNLHPATGEPLTVRTRSERRVGYDFTFSVPKSVSLLYAMSGDQGIMDAFRGAVAETMREIEAEMKTRVRMGGKDEDRVTGNMAWAEFIHTTSRPVDGIPDPQLHAHVFVFNTTWDKEERRWKAGQFAEIKRDAPYFQAGSGIRRGAQTRRFRACGHTSRCAQALFAAHGPDREIGRGAWYLRSRSQGGTRGRDP